MIIQWIRLLSAPQNPGDPIDVVVKNFPFRIGRQSRQNQRDHVDLAIADSQPFSISRLHCEIDRCPEGFLVRDCGSTLGTSVNGVRIGPGCAASTAVLGPGPQELVLGGLKSLCIYSVFIEQEVVVPAAEHRPEGAMASSLA